MRGVYLFRTFYRIKKRSDFLYVQDNGRKFRSSCYLLIYLPRESFEYDTRIGFTVTTKIDKRAVIRNSIKRRWREFFRLNRSSMRTGLDIVIVALTGSVEQSYEDFIKEAQYLFRKAKLM